MGYSNSTFLTPMAMKSRCRPYSICYHLPLSTKPFLHTLLAVWLCFFCSPYAIAQVRHRGIDVSKYQGTINWSKVARDSTIRFVYIKATEGTTLQDPRYRANLTGAKKAGLLVGSYHLYSSKTTAYQQMSNIRKTIKKKEQDLIPVLDIEARYAKNLNMQRVNKLLELMEKEYGVKPMIYTSESIYKSHFSGRRYSKYHIFIANYRRYPTTRFTLWQYTEKGHCPGIGHDVDFSRLHRNHTLGDIRMPKPKPKANATTSHE